MDKTYLLPYIQLLFIAVNFAVANAVFSDLGHVIGFVVSVSALFSTSTPPSVVAGLASRRLEHAGYGFRFPFR